MLMGHCPRNEPGQGQVGDDGDGLRLSAVEVYRMVCLELWVAPHDALLEALEEGGEEEEEEEEAGEEDRRDEDAARTVTLPGLVRTWSGRGRCRLLTHTLVFGYARTLRTSRTSARWRSRWGTCSSSSSSSHNRTTTATPKPPPTTVVMVMIVVAAVPRRSPQ